MNRTVALNLRVTEYINAIQEVENEFGKDRKSFSRILNYLAVLGIEKYAEINNIDSKLLDTSFFDFSKHKEIVDPATFAKKREKLQEKFLELKNKYQVTQGEEK